MTPRRVDELVRYFFGRKLTGFCSLSKWVDFIFYLEPNGREADYFYTYAYEGGAFKGQKELEYRVELPIEYDWFYFNGPEMVDQIRTLQVELMEVYTFRGDRSWILEQEFKEARTKRTRER